MGTVLGTSRTSGDVRLESAKWAKAASARSWRPDGSEQRDDALRKRRTDWVLIVAGGTERGQRHLEGNPRDTSTQQVFGSDLF
jgi:hypothetical protein